MAGEDPKYSAWIRQQPCRLCGCDGPSEQHHKSGAGMGLRAHDWYSMPLCRKCHHVGLGRLDKDARRRFEFESALLMREIYLDEREDFVPEQGASGEEVF